MISSLVKQLASLKLGKQDMVVLDLLLNMAFMGPDYDGLPTEAARDEVARYHVIGSLTIAPPLSYKKDFDNLPVAGCCSDGNSPDFTSAKICLQQVLQN